MGTARISDDPSRATNCHNARSRILDGRHLLEGNVEKAELRETLFL